MCIVVTIEVLINSVDEWNIEVKKNKIFIPKYTLGSGTFSFTRKLGLFIRTESRNTGKNQEYVKILKNLH